MQWHSRRSLTFGMQVVHSLLGLLLRFLSVAVFPKRQESQGLASKFVAALDFMGLFACALSGSYVSLNCICGGLRREVN